MELSPFSYSPPTHHQANDRMLMLVNMCLNESFKSTTLYLEIEDVDGLEAKS